MHDGEVEDRVRKALRGEGDELPLTITPDELERRLALRRRERRGRRVSLVAAALAVVAVSSLTAATNGWLRLPNVGTGPEASATPESTKAATPKPTEAGLGCTTIEPNANDQPPTIVLGASPGDSIAYGGALGAYHIGDRASGEEGVWASIDPERLQRVPATPPTERLVVLASNPDACLVGLVVDAVPVGSPDAPPQAVAALRMAPTRTIEFNKPPFGEWLARVHATFATRAGVTAWTETYFRVDAREATARTPTPENFGQFPQVDGIVLVQDASRSVSPSDPTGQTEQVVLNAVPPRAQYRIDVNCLGAAPLRWSIGREGEAGVLFAADEPCDGIPGAREISLGTPSEDLPIVVQADPASAWWIMVSTIAGAPAFIPPPLQMSDPAATGISQAYGRCVSTTNASDQCAGEWFTLDGAGSILIPPGSGLSFTLQGGWTIEQARITAAVADEVRATAFPHEYSVGFVDAGGSTINVPVELGRGSWIVRVALNASKEGETFGAYYDLPLVVGE